MRLRLAGKTLERTYEQACGPPLLRAGWQREDAGLSFPSVIEQGGESVEVCCPAVPETLARARAIVATLATRQGASAEQLERIRLVVSEAVANVVMHAYGESGGDVQLTAAVIGGELIVIVADDGCGLGAAATSRGLGHGMRLIAEGCDSLSILRRSSGGTHVEMRFALACQEPPRAPARAGERRLSCEGR